MSKDSSFLCACCSMRNGINVYHSDYHKIQDQRDELLKACTKVLLDESISDESYEILYFAIELVKGNS